MEYIQSSNTIIISTEFIEVLTNEHIEIISKFNKVIFSDFKLNDKLFKVYENKENGYDDEYDDEYDDKYDDKYDNYDNYIFNAEVEKEKNDVNEIKEQEDASYFNKLENREFSQYIKAKDKFK